MNPFLHEVLLDSARILMLIILPLLVVTSLGAFVSQMLLNALGIRSYAITLSLRVLLVLGVLLFSAPVVVELWFGLFRKTMIGE